MCGLRESESEEVGGRDNRQPEEVGGFEDPEVVAQGSATPRAESHTASSEKTKCATILRGEVQMFSEKMF